MGSAYVRFARFDVPQQPVPARRPQGWRVAHGRRRGRGRHMFYCDCAPRHSSAPVQRSSNLLSVGLSLATLSTIRNCVLCEERTCGPPEAESSSSSLHANLSACGLDSLINLWSKTGRLLKRRQEPAISSRACRNTWGLRPAGIGFDPIRNSLYLIGSGPLVADATGGTLPSGNLGLQSIPENV